MRSFIIACIAVVVIAAIGAAVLNFVQKPVDVAFTTDESIQGLSVCRDPRANAGAEDLIAPERTQAFHFFLRARFHRSVTVD